MDMLGVYDSVSDELVGCWMLFVLRSLPWEQKRVRRCPCVGRSRELAPQVPGEQSSGTGRE